MEKKEWKENAQNDQFHTQARSSETITEPIDIQGKPIRLIIHIQPAPAAFTHSAQRPLQFIHSFLPQIAAPSTPLPNTRIERKDIQRTSSSSYKYHRCRCRCRCRSGGER